MKKILYGTTALLAAGMISTAANAAEPLKLQLGGYMNWYVAAAENDDGYRKALSNNVAGDGDFNQFDVMGDSEVYFTGSTLLDNGMKVSAHIELETGTANNGTRAADETYLTVDSAYGRVIAGATRNVASKMHVSAPEVGVLDVEESDVVDLVTAPGNITALDATWLNTDGKLNKISYVSPTYYGVTLGATWTPGADDTTRGTNLSENSMLQDGTFKEGYALNAMYAGSFVGVDVTTTAAFGSYNVGGKSAQDEYSLGLNVAYAGFTLGGGYREVSDNNDATGWNGANRAVGTTSVDGYAWNVGGSYEAGPYGVSLNYFKSEVEGDRAASAADLANAGQDEFEAYMLSGKYNLGAGVDSFATIARVEYTDEDNTVTGAAKDILNNEGWAFATGIALSF